MTFGLGPRVKVKGLVGGARLGGAQGQGSQGGSGGKEPGGRLEPLGWGPVIPPPENASHLLKGGELFPRRTCSGTGPIAGASCGRRAGDLGRLAPEAEGLKRRPPEFRVRVRV